MHIFGSSVLITSSTIALLIGSQGDGAIATYGSTKDLLCVFLALQGGRGSQARTARAWASIMRSRDTDHLRLERALLKSQHLVNRLCIELLYRWTNARIWGALVLFWALLVYIRLLAATNDSFQVVLKVRRSDAIVC